MVSLRRGFAGRHVGALACAVLSAGLSMGIATDARAQAASGRMPDLLVRRPESLPQWMVLQLNKDSESARRLAALDGRGEVVKEIRTLRFDYFRAAKDTELRQIGLSRLREYADRPEAYPILLDAFRRTDNEVRGFILDMIADQRTSDSDATLAWFGVHDRDPWIRSQAEQRLQRRLVEGEGKIADSVTWILAHRILEGDRRYLGHAAGLADSLSIVQLIPHLIQAQVNAAPRGNNQTSGDKAWIMVGRQVGFVSDLQPVVADSAVAFDPTISVINEGVLLRVQDGFVVTYISEVQVPLMRLGSRAIGYDLAQRGLGWDQDRWWTWYHDELVPALAAKDAARTTAGG